MANLKYITCTGLEEVNINSNMHTLANAPQMKRVSNNIAKMLQRGWGGGLGKRSVIGFGVCCRTSLNGTLMTVITHLSQMPGPDQ